MIQQFIKEKKFSSGNQGLCSNTETAHSTKLPIHLHLLHMVNIVRTFKKSQFPLTNQ